MANGYQVKTYAHDDLEGTDLAVDEHSALAVAYARIGTNGVRVAHVIKEGTQSGIYIARSTDLQRASMRELVATLRKVQWS